MAQRIQELQTPPETEMQFRPPRRRRSYVGVWLLLLAALGYGAFRYYQTTRQKQESAAEAQAARVARRAVPVAGVPVRRGELPVYVRGLGSAAAFNTVQVKSRVDGQLIAIHFNEGQFVKEGQLIAEIDPRPFQVQLEQAEGQLARDEAQLKDAQANLARF